LNFCYWAGKDSSAWLKSLGERNGDSTSTEKVVSSFGKFPQSLYYPAFTLGLQKRLWENVSYGDSDTNDYDSHNFCRFTQRGIL